MTPPNSLPPKDEKAAFREKLKAIRDAVDPAKRNGLPGRLEPAYKKDPNSQKAKASGLCLHPKEINTYPSWKAPSPLAKTRPYPGELRKNPLRVSSVTDLKKLSWPFGIQEATSLKPADWNELDLVLVPDWPSTLMETDWVSEGVLRPRASPMKNHAWSSSGLTLSIGGSGTGRFPRRSVRAVLCESGSSLGK